MASTTCTRTEPATSDAALRFAVAGRFIDGIVDHDFEAVVGSLTEDVTFRALLPRRVLDLEGAAAVRTIFHTWFGAAEHWELLEAVVGEVGGRIHLRWRLRFTKPDLGPGTFLVEQQAYADTGPDGRLSNVALICTGYLRDAS
jgi:SnoaL-like domain